MVGAGKPITSPISEQTPLASIKRVNYNNPTGCALMHNVCILMLETKNTIDY